MSLAVTGGRVSGVLPVLATPYTADWRVDAGELDAEIGWLYANGADGLTVGMVSEITRLSPKERMRLGELTCKSNAGRGPVVLSVGAESVPVATALAQHAQWAGATALMVNAPLVVRPGPDELFHYFVQVIETVDLPVVIQDASGYAGAPLPLSLQVALYERYGADRILFKPEAIPIGPRLTELHELTGGQAGIFEGSGGAALLESYRRGVTGTMPGPDLVWATSALWGALTRDAVEEAYVISGALAPIISLMASLDSYVAVEKYLLVKQKVLTNGRMRRPVDYELDAATRYEVDQLFERLRDAVATQMS